MSVQGLIQVNLIPIRGRAGTDERQTKKENRRVVEMIDKQNKDLSLDLRRDNTKGRRLCLVPRLLAVMEAILQVMDILGEVDPTEGGDPQTDRQDRHTLHTTQVDIEHLLDLLLA
jgi:hypothetical protein